MKVLWNALHLFACLSVYQEFFSEKNIVLEFFGRKGPKLAQVFQVYEKINAFNFSDFFALSYSDIYSNDFVGKNFVLGFLNRK